MPRPLPKLPPRKAPEVTAEGLQYKVAKWLDEAAIEIFDDLARYGSVDDDDDVLFLTTLDGKKFRISITTAVEVEEHGS